MTPAQIDSLSRLHVRANGGGSRRGAPEQGGTADLLMFQNMRTA